MNFDHGLRPGDSVTNHQITSVFKCGPQGGMRRSLKTNTLLIISNHVKSIYEDRWVGDLLHYTGMGMTGDQNLNATQNRTLNESSTNGIDVYLFEVFQDKTYTFRGKVILAEGPYQERQPDKSGSSRKVWIFPVKLIDDGESILLEENHLLTIRNIKEKVARKLSDDELTNRSKYAKKSGLRFISTRSYERNCYVNELAKRRADGHCTLCRQPAPFLDSNKKPYLETHHIHWLSKDGEDTIENTVALCPNCHRKMHILNLSADVEILRNRVSYTSCR